MSALITGRQKRCQDRDIVSWETRKGKDVYNFVRTKLDYVDPSAPKKKSK
jgi:hypothetical protein